MIRENNIRNRRSLSITISFLSLGKVYQSIKVERNKIKAREIGSLRESLYINVLSYLYYLLCLNVRSLIIILRDNLVLQDCWY